MPYASESYFQNRQCFRLLGFRHRSPPEFHSWSRCSATPTFPSTPPIFYSLPPVFSVFRQRNLYRYVRRDVLLPTVLFIYGFIVSLSCFRPSKFLVFLVFRPLDYCRCSRAGHVTSCRSPAQGTLAMSYCHCTHPLGLGTPCSSGCVNSDFVLSAA